MRTGQACGGHHQLDASTTPHFLGLVVRRAQKVATRPSAGVLSGWISPVPGTGSNDRTPDHQSSQTFETEK